MEDRIYHLELLFGEIYREVELFGEPGTVIGIGTTRNCGIRLAESYFFEPFELRAVCNDDGRWFVECGDNVYFDTGDLMKRHQLDLRHGDVFTLRYEISGGELCHGEYYRSFFSGKSDYRASVLLSDQNSLRIGGTDACQIRIRDESIGGDYVTLTRSGEGWEVSEYGTRYGYEVNGARRTGTTQIRDLDFLAVTGHGFFLRGDRLYYCPGKDVSVQGVQHAKHVESCSARTYPHLTPSTRVYYETPDEKIKLQKPPAKPTPPDRNLLVTILPLVIMLGVMVLLRTAMGGGGMFIIFSVASMGVGVITSMYNYFHQKKKAAEDEVRRVSVYTEYIQNKETAIQSLREKEKWIAEQNAPDMDRTIVAVRNFDEQLYDRLPQHPDFMSVRLGTGQMSSACPVEFTPEEYRIADDEIADWPEYIQDKYARIDAMPVTLSLRDVMTVGIVGDAERIFETVKLMTIDIAVHHSHKDVQLCYLFPKEEQQKWQWIRWLRHVNNPFSGMRNLAYDEKTYKDLTDYLYKVISDREAIGMEHAIPHFVVFVVEPFLLLSHPLSRFLNEEKNYGVTFVFCANAAEIIPPCRKLIRLDTNDPVVIDAANGEDRQTFAPASIPDQEAARIAHRLACVEVDEVSLDAQLAKSITLYQLLGIFGANDLDLNALWSASQIQKTMAAPIGVDADGETVYLDLYEKAHGPHGLVAGTTGSGKSELLQTYILSMAVHYHPYEVGFVLIDFKGGGMANQFRDLPHLIGAITNIDGKEMERSLKSIRAELHKRERLFAEAGVNNIDGYIRKFRQHEVSVPLPHLILIVDEFAELKMNQPEFMKELVSASRIGRSLGVHLILATQKPSGVVDDQIWSNSHFRLCLKVQSAGDSNEMLKTPLAAEIQEPGRAYFQVGNNEIFTLFQSAYSGAPALSALASGQHSYALSSVALSGARTQIFRQQLAQPGEENGTELQELVNGIRLYCERSGITRLQGICLPPLAELAVYPDAITVKPDLRTMPVELGIYDSPETQYQGAYAVHLAQQNIMIIGSAQSGKTNLLQVMIRGIAEQYTPDQAHIYIIDCGSRVLKNFETLPHVGGVVTAAEDEKLKNLFKLLYGEIEYRKERLNQLGVSSFSAYVEAGKTDLAQIVLFIDNLTALKELYFRDDDQLIGLCREGQSVGLSVVIANSQTAGIGYRYLSNFSCRIAMFCNDSGEYTSLFDHCRMRIDDVRGRCIVEIEKQHYVCQTYRAFEGEREIERVEAIHAFIAETQERCGGAQAKQIPMIPALLTAETVQKTLSASCTQFDVVAGLDYDTVEPVVFSMDRIGLLALAGREGGGRHNWAHYAVRTLLARGRDNASVWIVDGMEKRFQDLRTLPGVERYTCLPADAASFVLEIESRLKARYDNMLLEREHEDHALLLLMIDNMDAVDAICGDMNALNAYKCVVSRYKQLGVCILLTCLENESIPYSAPELLKGVRDNRNLLYFGDLSELKVFDVPVSMAKRFRKRSETGDAYYLKGAGCTKLKTPLDSQQTNETLPENEASGVC